MKKFILLLIIPFLSFGQVTLDTELLTVEMLLDYYQCVVQFLTKWSPPPPKIESKKTESVQDKDVN